MPRSHTVPLHQVSPGGYDYLACVVLTIVRTNGGGGCGGENAFESLETFVDA